MLESAGAFRLRLLAFGGLLMPWALLGGAALAVLVMTRSLTLGAHPMAVTLLPLGLLPFLFWRLEGSVPVFFVAASALIERFGNGLADATTEHVPLFTSLSDGAGVPGVYLLPLELAMAIAGLALWLRSESRRSLGPLLISRLTISIFLLATVIIAAEVHGLAAGGDFKASLWEARPWFYIALLFLICSRSIRSVSTLKAVLWAMIVASGLKGVQGTIRFLGNLDLSPRPESLLEHDESFFLSVYLTLTAALWMFGVRGRLRTVATALVPFVVVAALGNGRRVIWLILGIQVVILLAIGWVARPERRRLLLTIATLLVATTAVYLPVFWNGDGAIAQPARALRSAFSPDPRDDASNVYRQIENANLGIAIKETVASGVGFGLPIENVIPNAEIASIDPSIVYIPHNGILYLWMRTGTLGALAFWLFVSSVIVRGCLLARKSSDPIMATLGSAVVMVMIAYVIQGWYDMGLTSLRIAVYVGALAGCVEAMARLTFEQSGIELSLAMKLSEPRRQT